MAEATTTLEDAREQVKLAVQDLPGVTVGGGTDGLKRLDYAIRAAGREFIRLTGCNLASGTKAATANDTDLNVSTLSSFHPSRLLRVTATDPDDTDRIYPVDVVNYRDVLGDDLSTNAALQTPFVWVSTLAVNPHKIAFKDESNAVLWPTPGKAWVYTFYYTTPLTSWTIGVTDGSAITLNIPDEMIDGVLWYGVPAFFENPNPANRYQQSSRSRFDRHIAECRGRTGLTKAIQANIRDYI